MNAKQQARLNALERGVLFFNDNSSVLDGLDFFTGKKSIVVGLIKKIKDASLIQAIDTSTITEEKDEDRKTLTDLIYIYVVKAYLMADSVGNSNLEKSFDYPITYFTEGDDLQVINRATDKKDVIKDNLGILTNISEDDVTLMETAIQVFSDIKNKNRTAIETKKATGTDPIPGFLDDTMDPMKKIGKIIFVSANDYYVQFQTVTKVGKAAGTRHLDIVIIYRDSVTNSLLKGIKTILTDKATTIVKESTKLGSVRGKGMKSGNWKLTAESKTYVMQEINNIGINDDSVIFLEIKMVKK